MDRRRKANAIPVCASVHTPESSGPLCAIWSAIETAVAARCSVEPPVVVKKPVIPHMLALTLQRLVCFRPQRQHSFVNILQPFHRYENVELLFGPRPGSTANLLPQMRVPQQFNNRSRECGGLSGR